MKCSDLQLDLSLYSDGLLSDRENVSIKLHLEICPLCRQQNAEYRELRASLQTLRRPTIPQSIHNELKMSVRNELHRDRIAVAGSSVEFREWLQMRVMPYGVGVFASVAIAFTFLTLMFSGLLRPAPVTVATGKPDTSLMLASNSNPFPDGPSAFISATDFANSRMGFANESPSINPQGGLVALTKSFLRGEMKDEEVVVVADVFGNGLAKISEVVESPRKGMAVLKLDEALRSDATSAPFVPAVLENRPENMRIVLKFKSVNVSTNLKPIRRRS